MPLTLGIYSKLNDLHGDEVHKDHAYSLVGAEEMHGKYYMKLRNHWRYNWDKNDNKKNAVITVDLEGAIRAESCILKLNEEEE